MIRSVHPSRIDGEVVAPPSKSVMLRVLAASLIAGEGRIRIRNPSLCGDVLSGIRVVESLGATTVVTPGEVRVEGGMNPRGGVLDCGESGLCLRMFTAIAALWHEELTLTGRGSLLLRPTTPVEGAIAALGARCRTRDGAAPVSVRGPLLGGHALVEGGVTSQFLSGLLLALPTAKRDSVLTVTNLTSRPYVDLTLRLLDRFGVRIEREGYERFTISGGQRPTVGEFEVEGDWSAAALLFVLGAAGGRIRVTGLSLDSAQADRQALEVVEAAGARVTRLEDGALVEQGDLVAFEFDASDAPDLIPPLAALACHCKGTSVLRGVRRLRHKECDRADAVAREFSELGARIAIRGDSLEIRGGPLDGGSARARGDHRVAMALAAAAVGARGPVSIDGAEHVGKSYPQFFTDLVAVGGRVESPVARSTGGGA